MPDIVIRIRPLGPTSAQTDDSNLRMVEAKHLDRLKRSFGDRYTITVERAD